MEWYRSVDCLWSARLGIHNKPDIGTQYASLEKLFVNHVGVKKVKLNMLLKELERLTEVPKTQSTIASVKELINRINNMNLDKKRLSSIQNASILPVRRKDGKVIFLSPGDDFVINDRQKLANAFQGKVAMLDFNLEDVRILEPFLIALDLGERYLSSIVKQTSSLNSGAGSPDHELTHSLRQKAHALHRLVRFRIDFAFFNRSVTHYLQMCTPLQKPPVPSR